MKVKEEAVRIVSSLPRDKAVAVLDYARYLAEKSDEMEWEKQFGSQKYAKKLKRAGQKALSYHRKGKTKPL